MSNGPRMPPLQPALQPTLVLSVSCPGHAELALCASCTRHEPYATAQLQRQPADAVVELRRIDAADCLARHGEHYHPVAAWSAAAA